ncbi:MAG: LCP family protein [Chloroflexota bacterium]
MNLHHRAFILLLLAALLAGCIPPGPSGQPLASLPRNGSPQPALILDVPGATATPTPFQPIPPTPIYVPGVEQPLPTATATPEPSPTPMIVLPTSGLPEEAPVSQPSGQVNILLLGSDQRPWGTGFRTDTIILVTLNAELGRVNLTSFPRDLYITIPGHGMDRINTAWVYGGYNLLKKTFKHNFGVQPDYYVLINFSSFKKIVDSLGGLEVDVAQPLADYRYGYWVSIPAGKVHMDADTVLWYVRSRKTTNDFARNRRQQEVLWAIFEKMLSLDALRRAPEFYQLYKSNVTTDIGLVQILTWLPLVAKVAESRDIHQYYIGPNVVSDWITPGGAMVLLPNQDGVMRIIRKSQNSQ